MVVPSFRFSPAELNFADTFFLMGYHNLSGLGGAARSFFSFFLCSWLFWFPPFPYEALLSSWFLDALFSFFEVWPVWLAPTFRGCLVYGPD